MSHNFEKLDHEAGSSLCNQWQQTSSFSTNQEQNQIQSWLEFRAISRAWRGLHVFCYKLWFVHCCVVWLVKSGNSHFGFWYRSEAHLHASGIQKREFHSENASNAFRPHARRTNLKTQQALVILHLCLSKTRAGEYHNYRGLKASFSKCFRPQENTKPAFSNSSALRSVFE